MFQTILIISQNPALRLTEAKRQATNANVDQFDLTIVERTEINSKTEEPKLKQSLGIEDVKTIQKTLYLKPFRGRRKAIIISEAHLLTIEAQNALLKVLEEPPDHTIFILAAETKEALLPTILSRASLVELERQDLMISDDDSELFREIIMTLPEWGVGKALKEAERLAKNKDEALSWLEKLIISTRTDLLNEISLTTPTSRTTYLLDLLKSLQETHKTIKTTNTNLRLVLENLFLGKGVVSSHRVM